MILVGCWMTVTALLVCPAPLHAEPYLAVRTGFKCTQCHVNRTGGGKRTEFGMVFTQTSLPMFFVRSPDGPSFRDGMLSDMVSMGANLRADNKTLFEFETSQGQRAGTSSEFQISEANVYFQMDLIPSILVLYIDQTLTPLNANREAFGLLQGLPGDSYVKMGRMLLPYGLRLLDDDAFIRNRTGYNYDRHDKGAELGLEPGPLSLVGNVTNTRASVVGSVVYRQWRLGGSWARETTRSKSKSVGAFGGATVGRLTLLGEADVITEGDTEKLAVMVEMSFLVLKGLNFKTVYEFFDRNRDVPNENDRQTRLTLGVEPFVTQFLQVGLFYRINNFIPQNLSENQDQLVLQFHMFF